MPDLAVAVFDLDGTLLDSADGIVAGFRHGLAAVGVEAPTDAELRADLGPPVDDVFVAAGVPAARLEEAVLAYRRYNLTRGIQQSRVYPGIRELLHTLRSAGVRLGVATAKRTGTAEAILTLHGLDVAFEVIVGTTDTRRTKTETLAAALAGMSDEPFDRTAAVMVGDRHSDVAAGLACGVRTVGVTWGYGSPAELTLAGAEVLLDEPARFWRSLV